MCKGIVYLENLFYVCAYILDTCYTYKTAEIKSYCYWKTSSFLTEDEIVT